MDNIKMFVITHKPLYVKTLDFYIPIKVGTNNNEKMKLYISDNTGDNISSKNSNYCELTAIYWLWKNYDLPKYIGICHYRRFFVKGIFSKILNENDINKMMTKNDVILPYPNKALPNVWEYFVHSKSCNNENELKVLKEIIKNKYPDYYEDFNIVMTDNKLSYCNMAIMKKKDFVDYCSWLFDILFEYEKKIDISTFNDEEKRIFGYVSEFLLNVWIRNKKKKIKYCSIIKYESSKLKTLAKKFKKILKDGERIITNEKK